MIVARNASRAISAQGPAVSAFRLREAFERVGHVGLETRPARPGFRAPVAERSRGRVVGSVSCAGRWWPPPIGDHYCRGNVVYINIHRGLMIVSEIEFREIAREWGRTVTGDFPQRFGGGGGHFVAVVFPFETMLAGADG